MAWLFMAKKKRDQLRDPWQTPKGFTQLIGEDYGGVSKSLKRLFVIIIFHYNIIHLQMALNFLLIDVVCLHWSFAIKLLSRCYFCKHIGDLAPGICPDVTAQMTARIKVFNKYRYNWKNSKSMKSPTYTQHLTKLTLDRLDYTFQHQTFSILEEMKGQQEISISKGYFCNASGMFMQLKLLGLFFLNKTLI